MKKAFEEGWGGVIAKTVSVDSSKVTSIPSFASALMSSPAFRDLKHSMVLQVTNVTPRYAKLRSDNRQVIFTICIT